MTWDLTMSAGLMPGGAKGSPKIQHQWPRWPPSRRRLRLRRQCRSGPSPSEAARRQSRCPRRSPSTWSPPPTASSRDATGASRRTPGWTGARRGRRPPRRSAPSPSARGRSSRGRSPWARPCQEAAGPAVRSGPRRGLQRPASEAPARRHSRGPAARPGSSLRNRPPAQLPPAWCPAPWAARGGATCRALNLHRGGLRGRRGRPPLRRTRRREQPRARACVK
mmetsp:Transcript_114908/g.246939  ORF Transcript_114908/g.246939 Transcript_114908/m.246939 type:complete len:222 (+) Transcript_114908:792-1457(+)